MRTLIWSGTVLVLLMAAGMFVAARHATRYPASFVGRCAVNFYRVWNPAADGCAKMPCPVDVAVPEQGDATNVPAGKFTPELDVVEPIIVDPTEQEPPLALPRLTPEITAAIERLRQEDESEAPAQPFDAQTARRMPYADEGIEVLPQPSAVADEENLPGTYGFFILPPACWSFMGARMIETLRQWSDASQGNEEAADEGTSSDESSGATELQQIPYDHHHRNSCPYAGGCPSPHHYRYVQPMSPAPARTAAPR